LPNTDASVELGALSAHIVVELAAGLSNAEAIRNRYGITLDQWKTLAGSLIFRKMLAEAIQRVGGDMGAASRIQLKADLVLEDAIPVYDGMIHNKEVPAQARIDAGKLLKELAGRGTKASEGNVGGGFILNINLGSKSVVIDGTAIAVDPE
jgi:hypothetical protein